jgi:hypothetical protein
VSKDSNDTAIAKGKEIEPHHFHAAPVLGRNNEMALMLSFGYGYVF